MGEGVQNPICEGGVSLGIGAASIMQIKPSAECIVSSLNVRDRSCLLAIIIHPKRYGFKLTVDASEFDLYGLEIANLSDSGLVKASENPPSGAGVDSSSQIYFTLCKQYFVDYISSLTPGMTTEHAVEAWNRGATSNLAWVKHQKARPGHCKSVHKLLKAGYTEEEIIQVIDFASTHEFWSKCKGLVLNAILRNDNKPTFENLLDQSTATPTLTADSLLGTL